MVISFVALVLTLLLTPIIQTLGLKTGCIDAPTRRKVHQTPVVRVGGIAITLSAFLTSLAWQTEINLQSPFDLGEFWAFWIGAAGFFALGISDDLFNLPPLPRLVGQLILASVVWHFGFRIEYLPVPLIGTISLGILSLPITVAWIVGLTNAINWLDGLDGLAVGISAIAASFLTLLGWQMHHPLAIGLALIVLGTTLGFFCYNVHPAKIFMGDGGSYFLGFSLATISIMTLMDSSRLTEAVVPYVILAVPILDMVWVIGGRLWAGQSPFYPDQRHLHHRLLKAGLSHDRAVQLIHLLALWVGSWALMLVKNPYGWIALLGSTFLLGLSLYRVWQTIYRSEIQLGTSDLSSVDS